MKACNVLAVQAQGATIVTIEGLAAADGTMHPMQAAFKDCHGLQCGFCTPGMVMSALDLVARHPGADEKTIREQLEGNLCRCTGYHNIVKAVQQGAAAMASRRSSTMGANETGFIGQSVKRKEDARFLTGAGQYTDDVTMAEPDARVLPALAARAREDPQASTRRRRRQRPAWSPSTPAPISKA